MQRTKLKLQNSGFIAATNAIIRKQLALTPRQLRTARKQIKPRGKVLGRHLYSLSIASCASVHDRVVADARCAQSCFVGQSLSAEEDLHISHCVKTLSERASIGMIKDLILEIADGPVVLCVKHADVPAGQINCPKLCCGFGSQSFMCNRSMSGNGS